MKHSLKPVLFIVTAFAGLAIGITMLSFILYQYLTLNANTAFAVLLGQSVVNAEQTNYIVIMVATLPLIFLSAFLMYRSVKRLRLRMKRARR